MSRDPKRPQDEITVIGKKAKRPVFYDAGIDAWRIELTKGLHAIVSLED